VPMHKLVNYLIATCECGVLTFSITSVCLSVCVSVHNALTFESLVLESLFLVCRYIFRIFRSGLIL